MPKQPTNAREIAEQAARRILIEIDRKINRFLLAEGKGDKMGMLLNQLSPEEAAFLQQQQKIETNAQHTDAEIEQLKGMDTENLDKMFQELLRQSDTEN